MKPAQMFRVGGLCVSACCAVLGGPVAIASAQPSAPNHHGAATAPSKAATNAAHRLQVLQGQQAKLQLSTATIQGAENAKLSQERDAALSLKATSTATHSQASSARQQVAQALNGVITGTGGVADLHTLAAAEKLAAQSKATAVQAQFAATQAAEIVAMQKELNTLTGDLLNVLAKIQQDQINAQSAILRA